VSGERLDVDADALARFLAEDDGEPVVLVNLVRVRAGGEAAYRAYGAAVAPLLERVGAELLYAGTARGCLIGDEPWDVAVVTRYPSRRALAELVRDPEFEAAAPLRHEALEAGILHAFA
jgi:uncharacterized protein (DUF1330 family)